jgi:hypothetical protein
MKRSGGEVYNHFGMRRPILTPLLDGGNGRDSGAEAYTGAGGKASGGSVEGKGGLINLFSGAYRTPGWSIAPEQLVRQWWRRWRC